MRTLSAEKSVLMLIDFQGRLMPAIHDAEVLIVNTCRLLGGAKLLDVPIMVTEQNPRGLGATVPELGEVAAFDVTAKMTFDACNAQGFYGRIPQAKAIIVAGCEAHVCVLQTVFGLLDRERQVFVVRDAVGSRLPDSKDAAIRRMERNGAEIVTTEMVLFEWLGTAEHQRFREVMALIK